MDWARWPRNGCGIFNVAQRRPLQPVPAMDQIHRWELLRNWVGVFYGNIPYNFSTTHISLHHRLDAGRGDTLYNWDIPRGCVPSFMLYLVRGLAHCTGFGGLLQFYRSPRKRDNTVCFRKLLLGCFIFWV